MKVEIGVLDGSTARRRLIPLPHPLPPQNQRKRQQGLYTGAGPTMLRDFVGNAFYFSAYELTKRALLARGGVGGLKELGETPAFVVSGGVAGCAYWAGMRAWVGG